MRGQATMDPGGMELTAGAKWLLIVTVVTYVLELLAGHVWGAPRVLDLFALVPDLFVQGWHLWQPLTYALLHDPLSPGHLIFNGLALYFFGPPLERRWGTARFLRVYVACALVAAAFVVLEALVRLSWQDATTWRGHTVGASGAIMGLIAAFAILNADQPIYFFFVVRMRARTLLWVEIGLNVLYALTSSPVSYSAHFGGIAAGWALAVWLRSRRGKLRAVRRGGSVFARLRIKYDMWVRRRRGYVWRDPDDDDGPKYLN